MIDLPDWPARKKKIYVHTFPRTINPEVDKAGSEAELDKILKDIATEFQEAVTDGVKGVGGTIVLDGGTMLHNHLSDRAQKKAVQMKKDRIWGSAYTERNNFWKALMDTSKGCNRHLIAIHHATVGYDGSGPTDEIFPAGDKLVATEVDMIVHARRSPGKIWRDSKGKPIIGPSGKPRMDVALSLLIQDCRRNSSLREVELHWMTYDALYQLVRGS